MPVTELFTGTLHNTPESRAALEAIIKPGLLALAASEPGVGNIWLKPLILENGINVESEAKIQVGIEWQAAQNFHAFLIGEKFQYLGPLMAPFFEHPSEAPAVYETGSSPSAVFDSPLTEVFRFPAGNEFALKDTIAGWEGYVAALQKSTWGSGIKVIGGKSVNLDEPLWVGIVGWDDAESRERALKSEGVREHRAKIESVQRVKSFVSRLGGLDS